MTIAQKIEESLKDEMKPESIKTIVELAEFLKFKEDQLKWNKINESDPDYITGDERTKIEEKAMNGDFADQSEVIKELGINECEILN